MRRILFAAIALAACVPASEPAKPAGAAGFATRPSAASRGEPYLTSDGWTLRFEHVAFAVEINSVASVDYAFEAHDPVELWVPGLPTGPVSISLPYTGPFGGLGSDAIDLVRDPLTAARLHPSEEDSRDGAPNVVLVAEGTKAGRTVRLDLAISGTNTGPVPGTTVEVKADALTLAPLDVRIEELFVLPTGAGGSTAPAFEPFAAADRNGDGIVDVDELRAATVACSGSDACDETYGTNLLSALLYRAGFVLVAP